MEEINVGDIVRLKGEGYSKINFLVSGIQSQITPDVAMVSLLFISEKTYAPEKVWRIPSCCLTKIPMNKIEYRIDPDRKPESIVVGDVVSLKTNPNIKMVVKEVNMNGNEASAIYYNPIKGDTSEVPSIDKLCYDVYEMIVKK